MKLDRQVLEKADSLLRQALENARGDEVLRAVVTLGPAVDAEAHKVDARPGMTRMEYRSALIAKQGEALARRNGATIKALSAFNVKPRGGEMTPVVVIEGAAADISRSLALDGVQHASLDRKISLIEPVRRQPER